MFLVPAGSVIIERKASKFTETMCLMAFPYLVSAWYVLFHKTKQK